MAGPSRESDARHVLRLLFDTAIAAADPLPAVAANLPAPPKDRTAVIGVGKAAIQMAAAVEANWRGRLEGFVVAPHGYASSLKHIETLHASHPVPDGESRAAAEKALSLAANLGSDDLLIALVSGGGSSLMAKPAAGISMDEKLAIVAALLKSGASIAELNCVRRHISAVKGGRLAEAAAPAAIRTLVISDVPGDDPAVVASGPTIADKTSKGDALAVLERYRIDISLTVRRWLQTSDETRKVPYRGDVRVVVSPRQSFRAAAAKAEAMGLNVLYLGDRIEGEAREVAKVHAGLALQIRRHDSPVRMPCVLLSGGETSVTVTGQGRGGRNVEFLLSLAIALAGESSIHALAGDTDGVDGMEEIAGAVISPGTLDRARKMGLDAMAHLRDNDAHTFFERLGDQIVTGPTQTNVNDFRAILIGSQN